MNNYILSHTRSCIPYIKELRNIAGGVTASILMQQLDYWFAKSNGKPFYKFKSPCEHKMYKKGDSFTEELGFSIDEFTTAFFKIGTVFKSKTEFEKSQDKFGGKYYSCYIDRQQSLTFYYRNNALLDKDLFSLFTVNGESQFTGNGESQFAETEKSHLQKQAKPISHIYITEDYDSRLQQDIKTTAGGLVSNVSGVKESLTAQKSTRTKTSGAYSEEFKEFWNLYQKPQKAIDWSKKPALMEKSFHFFNARLKEMEFAELMRNASGYLALMHEFHTVQPMGILVFLGANGRCQEDYTAKLHAQRQKQATVKGTQGTSQKQPIKTPEEIEAERVQELALVEKKNVAYSRLTKEQQAHTDGFSNHLLTTFNHIHERWIFNCIFIVSGNEKTTLEIQIFNQRNTSVIEKNIEKILNSHRGFKFEVDNIILTQK